MNRTDFLFQDDEDKQYVLFEYKAHGRTHTFSAEYDECEGWSVIVDELIRTLESAYGYTFDLPNNLGAYYPGKSSGNE